MSKDDLKGILKKIEESTSKANSPTSSNAEASHLKPEFAGDPDCPHCGGLGYLRSEAPLGHPEFGRVQICSCRQDEVASQARNKLYATSHLNELKELTFENFEARGRVGLGGRQADSLEQAYNQSENFARVMEGWLVLQGGYGSGKTHLAAAIANFAVTIGLPTIFITVPDLLDVLRFSFNSEEGFEKRFEEIRQAPLLILDDFGTQNATEWAKEKLFQIFNFRYVNQLPTVITTNLSLDDIEGRIRSRLSDPELVTRAKILAPDYRRPFIDPAGNEISNLKNLNDMKFVNFELRENEQLPEEHTKRLEKAFEAARRFADKPKGWIVFYGSHGSGKTHLAASIANHVSDMGGMPLFITVIEFLEYLKSSFSPTSLVSYDRKFLEVRDAELLLLDGLGLESATPWAKEKLYQLFDYRFTLRKPTVITTANQLEQLDSFISSRMLDSRVCTIYSFTAPSYGRKKR